MSLVSRWLGDDRSQLIAIATDFQDVVHKQAEIIGIQQAEIARLKLEYARWGRGIVENFLIALERPEDDVRDILLLAIRDFDDEVARLEEHVS